MKDLEVQLDKAGWTHISTVQEWHGKNGDIGIYHAACEIDERKAYIALVDIGKELYAMEINPLLMPLFCQTFDLVAITSGAERQFDDPKVVLDHELIRRVNEFLDKYND